MSDEAPGALSSPHAWNLVAHGYVEVSVGQFERYAADALRLADLEPEDRVLDVAAGPGSLALQAARKVERVDALDFSPSMLEQLRLRAAERRVTNVFAREGDGQALPYEDASFDAAFSMFGLMFFPDRARGFRELARVLRPGGRAVVSSWQPMHNVPVLVAVFESLGQELPALPFPQGKGPLSDPEDFRQEMSAAGFQVELHEAVHALESPDMRSFWAGVRRSFAPLVLLESKLGAAFEPVADGIYRRLSERFGEGPVHAEMPAWLARGVRV
jgi:ubiquinone/menaquinone biosynthesis C-methylase UbiE